MKRSLRILSFTKAGTAVSKKIIWEYAERLDAQVLAYTVKRYAGEGINEFPGDVKAFVRQEWGKSDFLFIGAAGIAVRMIAPCVKDKYTDSAVIVMDESGKYVIPLLSGHVGGGVVLAKELGAILGATPVITTATDCEEKFAVDVFATNHGLWITDREIAKQISAAILDGEKVGVYISNDFRNDDIRDKVDEIIRRNEELVLCETIEALSESPFGIVLAQSEKERDYFDGKKSILFLLSKNVVVGIGCKKNTAFHVLEDGTRAKLGEHRLNVEQICAIVSIDLKAEEAGLQKLCEKYAVPFLTYTKEELRQTGEVSNGSSFVAQVTGVDNVCERAVKYYFLKCKCGHIIQEKVCLNGMTIAIGCVE